jgi:mono/diheme cytochrome c family protein
LVRLSGALLLAALAGGCSGAATDGKARDPGADLYAKYCIACHLSQGSGAPDLRPALAGSALVNGEPEPLAAWVMFGVRPRGWSDRRYPPVMPRYARLDDADLAILLTYLRSHFGNASAMVSPDTIAKVRAGEH